LGGCGFEIGLDVFFWRGGFLAEFAGASVVRQSRELGESFIVTS
jgi:hypothetical protein